jgi:hypothetical protein
MTPRDMPARGAVTHVCVHAPGKRRFATREDAITGYRTLRGPHVYPMYPYVCPCCGDWHLTSRKPQ